MWEPEEGFVYVPPADRMAEVFCVGRQWQPHLEAAAPRRWLAVQALAEQERVVEDPPTKPLVVAQLRDDKVYSVLVVAADSLAV